MRWQDMRESSNVEDRRGSSGLRGGVKIGGFGMIAVVVISLLFGKNPMEMLAAIEGDQNSSYQQTSSPTGAAANDTGRQFSARVLGDTEDTWNTIFQQQLKRPYRKANLVLFRNGVSSACGQASSAMGPFYCGADEKLYIDLGFFDELDSRFGAPGDFAQAYVIAHEVGHHVQNLLGISGQVQQRQAQVDEVSANQLSVRLELQADCLAGVWGHGAAKRGLLETGDLEEGLQAAHAIGDDTLQRHSRGQIVPDSFTHGSSAQRVKWFRTGLQNGNIAECDTFQARQL